MQKYPLVSAKLILLLALIPPHSIPGSRASAAVSAQTNGVRQANEPGFASQGRSFLVGRAWTQARQARAVSSQVVETGSRAPDAVDEIVRTGMAAERIPGLSLTVLRGGEVVRQSSYGLANLEQRTPVTAETAFSIGSLSKQIIAAGVMLLVQEGKIDLDASVSRYISDVPDAWRPITVRHLLTHTSGLLREAPGFDGERDQSVMDVLTTAYPLPLTFRPGERFEYSNTGYFLLAELITRVSATPWQNFIDTRFFRPLGMRATRPTSRVDIIPLRASGYGWRDGSFENVHSYLAVRPSGAFVSTASDLARWERSMVAGTILSRRSLERMWTAARLNGGEEVPYGFGWRLEQVNGMREIGHAGSLPGFRAYYARYPDQDLTIIALANANNSSTEPTRIARAVARELTAQQSARRTNARAAPRNRFERS